MQSIIEAWMRMTGHIHWTPRRIPGIADPFTQTFSWFRAPFPCLGDAARTGASG